MVKACRHCFDTRSLVTACKNTNSAVHLIANLNVEDAWKTDVYAKVCETSVWSGIS